METLYIVKIGGQVIDDPDLLTLTLDAVSQLPGKCILVHGGGRAATRLAGKLGIEQQMVAGRRVTDDDTLEVVVMVYAGLINKQIVAALQCRHCNAIGLSGADGGIMEAHHRMDGGIDYGHVGDIDGVDTERLGSFLDTGLVPVIAPIVADIHNGELLNCNADTIARSLATGLSSRYAVHLIYTFEREGVCLDPDKPETVIRELTSGQYAGLRASGAIRDGMIPKLDNAFAAIAGGVRRVVIGPAEQLTALVAGERGTNLAP